MNDISKHSMFFLLYFSVFSSLGVLGRYSLLHGGYQLLTANHSFLVGTWS